MSSFEPFVPHFENWSLKNTDGKRWRIESPRGWTMQPVGNVSAAEAEAICKRVMQAGAGGVVVKSLRWRRRRRGSDDFYVETDVGEYCVGLVHSSYAAIRRSIRDAQLHDDVLHRGLGLEEAKAICQADYSARIRSALAASPSAVPAGWKLVPVEPTKAMELASALRQDLPAGGRITLWGANAWAAMLAAAPTPPAPPVPASVEAVAVKRLEWNPYRAETEFGYFHIDDQTDRPADELKGRPPFLLTGTRLNLSRHDSLEAARAAAQAEFDRRVRASLTAPTQGHHRDFDDGYQWARNLATPTSSPAGGVREALADKCVRLADALEDQYGGIQVEDPKFGKFSTGCLLREVAAALSAPADALRKLLTEAKDWEEALAGERPSLTTAIAEAEKALGLHSDLATEDAP